MALVSNIITYNIFAKVKENVQERILESFYTQEKRLGVWVLDSRRQKTI